MRACLGTLLAVALGLTAVAVVGCGHGDATAAGNCAAPHHDPLDPRYLVHVLPGSRPPPYLTNPATSGEHQPVNVPSYRGVRNTPIAPQIQVALLESSQVLVLYKPALDAADIDTLRGFASNPLVTVAPDLSLPAPVVVSAWQWRLVCGPPVAKNTKANPAIAAFVAAHAGHGPQPPPPPVG